MKEQVLTMNKTTVVLLEAFKDLTANCNDAETALAQHHYKLSVMEYLKRGGWGLEEFVDEVTMISSREDALQRDINRTWTQN